MRKFLKNKKGVTILEGLIALTLLALVATGTFAVLLSTSRKSTAPDIREEMALAVEKAAQLLQVNVIGGEPTQVLDAEVIERVTRGLCCNHANCSGCCERDPFDTTTSYHSIDCLLPPICDKQGNNSYFRYRVIETRTNPAAMPRTADQAKTLNADGTEVTDVAGVPLRAIEFEIKCNGFTL